jgi:hypothetical protein
MSGYCQRPTSGTITDCGAGGPRELSCLSTGNVKNRSCQPFITPVAKTVSWSCAYPVGAGIGVAGSTCTMGSDCRSGFCAANGYCLWACQGTQDCVTPALVCNPTTIDVEGVFVAVKSCAP